MNWGNISKTQAITALTIGLTSIQAADASVFIDEFNGSALNTSIWDAPSAPADGGIFVVGGGTLGVDSEGDVNGRSVEVSLANVLGADPINTIGTDWQFDVDLYLGDASSIIGADSDEGITLNLEISNALDSSDSFELNFALVDAGALGGTPGVDHVLRAATSTDGLTISEQVAALGTNATTGQTLSVRANYDANNATISGFYNTGAGYIAFTPIADVSGWGMSTGDEFKFELSGLALKLGGGDLTGSYSFDATGAYFDNAALAQVPEPSTPLLVLCASLLTIRRNRNRRS